MCMNDSNYKRKSSIPTSAPSHWEITSYRVRKIREKNQRKSKKFLCCSVPLRKSCVWNKKSCVSGPSPQPKSGQWDNSIKTLGSFGILRAEEYGLCFPGEGQPPAQHNHSRLRGLWGNLSRRAYSSFIEAPVTWRVSKSHMDAALSCSGLRETPKWG